MIQQELTRMCSDMQRELTHNILPFWTTQMADEQYGGFYGRIDGHGNRVNGEAKGGILNARILWTFSSAYIRIKDPLCRLMAERAYHAVISDFFDRVNRGTYWKVTFDGKPLETKKQIYSQAFFIYAFTEYYKATGEQKALETAISLYRLIEEKSFDSALNGYFEAYSNDWKLLDDLRLSDKDVNSKKTTNTHLHILEAYTSLYSVWKDHSLEKRLGNLVRIFLEKIIDSKSHHLQLFFDEAWNSQSLLISYGHDIEASWLIVEAARALGDVVLLEATKAVCIKLAIAALEGFQDDGSLIYEHDPETGHTDRDRHWWPQAEAIVGLVNLYELTRNDLYLSKALQCWNYISSSLIDRENGEWYWSIYPDGTPNLKDDKAGFWKCPYHNSRACLEVMDRLKQLELLDFKPIANADQP